jgi:hypothetical protein
VDIEPNDCTFCATKDAANMWAQAVMNSLMPIIETGAKVLAGIDFEWIMRRQRQICYRYPFPAFLLASFI